MCADQYHGYVLSVAKVRHFRIIIVDRVEAALVLQAKHKDYRIHPAGELQDSGKKQRAREERNIKAMELKDENKSVCKNMKKSQFAKVLDVSP